MKSDISEQNNKVNVIPVKQEKLNDQNEEKIFLEGPHSRKWEFFFTLKILMEFIKGFRTLHFVGPCVTVFGSARFKEDHPFYEQARTIGGCLAKMGFTVMTGGGPGIMEAANRGAKEAGGESIGCNIILPMEQHPNPYLDKWVDFDYFFVRKVLLTKYSYAFVVMPGGLGTMDEFFEALTLIQTHKVKKFPVVLIGTEYHKHLIAHFEYMAKAGTIHPEDLKLFLFTDSIDEAIAHLEKYAVEGFGLKRRKRLKSWSILGE
ncbi:MAG: TIGR00730 family Rossman fold protein [Sporocytophaga sp.]|uniref:LOG family protein n=1 Tax=Sporocytophaga sp. TaxID=2231183 RepID=UPI001B032184|nr:TIGR00730 family Rossman fold protein [Sporocytophaga sp.]MBO9698893.1 TIGR00730 family Rossman fold protein [Sporocytophaga sp.]